MTAPDGLSGALMMDQGISVETMVDSKTERLPMHQDQRRRQSPFPRE
jgi:hypothetical protein